MVAGVCWSRSYLVFWLWGSRCGGGGLLVVVVDRGCFWWSAVVIRSMYVCVGVKGGAVFILMGE